MGLLLIFLGLLTAGVLADYVSENHILDAPNQTVMLFGTKITVSGVAPLVAAFLAGALTILLIVVGIGMLRGSWGRRRNLKRRIEELEWQNTELRSRERLQEVVEATHSRHFVEIPESETTEPDPSASESQPTANEPEPTSATSTHEEIGASSG
jgi:hypothetical protein